MIRAKARGEAPAEARRRRRRRPKPNPARRPSRARKRSGPRPAPAWSGSATAKLQELADRINAELGPGHRLDHPGGAPGPAEKLVEVALYLRDRNPIRYDYLASLQSVHFEDCIEVNYQLDSTEQPGTLDRAAGAHGRGRGPGRSPLALSTSIAGPTSRSARSTT